MIIAVYQPGVLYAGEALFALKEDKVCQFLAETLLRTAGRFNLQDFLQAWQDSVPEGNCLLFISRVSISII